MDLSLLQDILVLLGFSVIIVFLLQRIKLPSILGFLITGIVIGPHGFSLVQEVEQVETISQIGVILLLFVIGMEMSIKQLALIKKTVFVGGFLQVGLTVISTAFIYRFFDAEWPQAVFMGFLFSLSSTAIVLSILQERNEISKAHGRNALGILIFQDIIVVPMMLVTPLMAGNATTSITSSILMLLGKTLVVLVITYVLARYIIPKLMYYIAKTNSKELFLLTTITICFAVADLTALAGLSLALGAFLAGLIISESEYSHQATSIILPFRELFTSFFFISVGMLMNLDFFIHHVGTILLLMVLLFIVKSGVTAIAIAVLKYPAKTVMLTALALFQVGEFAFIMAVVGIDNGLLDQETYQYFLAISICSMLATPFVLMYSDKMTEAVLGLFSKKKKKDFREKLPNKITEETANQLENHLIIVGYGINGKALARAAEMKDIPYVVLETNADTVEKEKVTSTHLIYGDASNTNILNMVNLYKARVIVVAVTNFEISKNIILAVRSVSKSVRLMVRTRFVSEMEDLKALGANVVVSKELEASIEMFSRVMHDFLMPEDEIITFTEAIRADNQTLFGEEVRLPRTFKAEAIPNFNITALRVFKDSGSPLGISLKNLDLRAKFGINIIAINRNEEMIANLSSDEKIQQNDLLYVQGEVAAIENFRKTIG